MKQGFSALAGLALLGIAGCTMIAAYRMPRIAACEVALPRPGDLEEDRLWRLRVHTRAAEVSEGYEVVLQKRGDTLTFVGLTRFGATAFTIVQRGDEVEVQSAMKPIEAVPPLNLLADVYRWPLGALETEDAVVEVAADGRSATIVNDACGYRTNIVDISDGLD